jgi:hypothetical protein
MYSDGKISSQELEDWANLIESRDDIGFDSKKLQDIIFKLANPILYGKIDNIQKFNK